MQSSLHAPESQRNLCSISGDPYHEDLRLFREQKGALKKELYSVRLVFLIKCSVTSTSKNLEKYFQKCAVKVQQ